MKTELESFQDGQEVDLAYVVKNWDMLRSNIPIRTAQMLMFRLGIPWSQKGVSGFFWIVNCNSMLALVDGVMQLGDIDVANSWLNVLKATIAKKYKFEY